MPPLIPHYTICSFFTKIEHKKVNYLVNSRHNSTKKTILLQFVLVNFMTEIYLTLYKGVDLHKLL